MKQFLKHKFYGKLLNFLKYKRYKKIRTFISFSKKKIDYNSNINYNVKNRQYFLKKGDLDSFLFDSFNNGLSGSNNVLQKKDSFINFDNSAIGNESILQNILSEDKQKQDNLPFLEKDSNLYKINKKKYKLNSFLFNMLCQFSRGRVNSLLGQEILFRYYTIPYRLSLSRFIGNKVLRSYYKNLSKKSLLNLRKQISLKAKRANQDKKEITKNFLCHLENRLDSSLLRLLHFKSLYTKKYQSFILPNLIEKKDNFSLQEFDDSLINKDSSVLHNTNLINKRQKALTLDNLQILFKTGNISNSSTATNVGGSNSNILEKKSVWRKIKSPWKNFSVLQVKQQISHGHISVNGKKVKSPNIQLSLYDQITLNGFISNPFFSNNLKCTPRFDKKQLNNTLFFRNPAHLLTDLTSLNTSCSKNFLNFQDNPDSLLNHFFSIDKKNTSLQHFQSLPKNDIFLLCDFIKNLKIKRFSEIFYLTYKNFFLLSDSSIFSKTFSSTERFLNLKFFFQSIGFNQSIYFLWPLFSLLSIQSWTGALKGSIIHSATSVKRADSQKSSSFKDKSTFLNSSLIQKNLKDLLSLKNFQTKLALSKQHSQANSLTVSNFLNESNNKLLNNVMLKNKPNFSWLFNRSPLDNCYASVVYGTRKCKWVQLQQQKKGGFYNKIYHKINFFELELDFFQLAYRHYKSN